MPDDTTLCFANWGVADAAAPEVSFLHEDDELPESLQHCRIVLGRGGEARATELLERGAACVLLGDVAMLDCAVVSRLVGRYGSARIGVAVLARRRHISWSLDTVSNEDFRCLTPSVGKTGWEIMLSDGSASGTDAEWWLGEMLKLGASTALIRVDIEDDDLNLCAGLVEAHGSKLWFSPWLKADADLEPWVRYGQIRQLLLPQPNERDEQEMQRIMAAARPERSGAGTEEAFAGVAA
jgi:hypothetical protein